MGESTILQSNDDVGLGNSGRIPGENPWLSMIFEAQNELLRLLGTLRQTTTPELMLKGMLQQTLKLVVKWSDSGESSLFWLNNQGQVSISILARGPMIREEKDELIGTVLSQGLAGWVYQHRQVGLITDTMFDERWINLPGQPYHVRSALCLPITKGKQLMGIITLTHEQPNHFHTEVSHQIKSGLDQLALILDLVRLGDDGAIPSPSRADTDDPITLPSGVGSGENEGTIAPPDLYLPQLGMFMMTLWGRLIYANPRLAQVFGYEAKDLLNHGSFLKLIHPDEQDDFLDRLGLCLRGEIEELNMQVLGMRKNGQMIHVDLYGRRTRLYGKYVLLGVLAAV